MQDLRTKGPILRIGRLFWQCGVDSARNYVSHIHGLNRRVLRYYQHALAQFEPSGNLSIA